MKYVNVYVVDRRFGGPEEGGWWFDTGTPVASIPVEDDQAEPTRDKLRERYPDEGHRYSMAQRDDDYAVVIEDEFAVAWPSERPHYE